MLKLADKYNGVVLFSCVINTKKFGDRSFKTGGEVGKPNRLKEA